MVLSCPSKVIQYYAELFEWEVKAKQTFGKCISGEQHATLPLHVLRGVYFLSQEVRENRGHFIPLTARVFPLRLGDFHAQNSNFYS